MLDTGLFLSLAEIAGVFVGFGALIAVRSGPAIAASEARAIFTMSVPITSPLRISWTLQ